MSAYAKAHFPRVFFLSYLRLAKDKINPQEEILELICNAKEMDINVYGPDIRLKNKEFEISNKNIYFGLTNIKGVGESVFIKLYDLIKDIDLSTYTWPRILFDILLKINSTAAKALILSGSLDFIKLSRNTMVHEYSLMNELSNKETEQCIDFARNIDANKIENIIRHLISNGKITSNRKPKVLSILNQLHTPSYSMIDSPEWVSDNERELLGTSITCTKTDSYDASYSNTDCKDIKTFSSNKQFFVVAEISDLNIIKTKRGKNPGQEMCFIKISDSYGYADCVMFPDDFINNRDLLSVGRVLMFNGQKGTKDNSIIIKKCFVV
jgi:DNA polymerase-3 subunit alpha